MGPRLQIYIRKKQEGESEAGDGKDGKDGRGEPLSRANHSFMCVLDCSAQEVADQLQEVFPLPLFNVCGQVPKPCFRKRLQ